MEHHHQTTGDAEKILQNEATINECNVLIDALRLRSTNLNIEVRLRDKKIEQLESQVETLTRSLNTAQSMISENNSNTINNNEKDDSDD